MHPSLLPRWRGAAPVERAILAGDEETGVTIHETVEALDAGPIAAQEAFPIGPDDDAGAVFARAAEVAARLLDGVLPAPSFAPQPEDGVTYAEKIAPADRELDLADPVDAWRRVRALSPHIGAWTTLHGRRVTVWRARLEDGAFVPVEVQPEGKRRMGYDEFLRGAAVIAPARRAAFEVVRRVFEEGAYADRALAPAAAGLDARDRALAQRIAYGTVQRVRTIDHGIDELGRRPAAQARPGRAGGAAHRGLRARLERGAGARGRRRRGRARPRGAGSSARRRSRTRSRGGSPRASARSSRRCPTGR